MSFEWALMDRATRWVCCDKCKEVATPERPVINLWTSGRNSEDRNFIYLHLDCLEQIIKTAHNRNLHPEEVGGEESSVRGEQ